MTGGPRILFESPRLRVVYQPGESDWLVYSFNGGDFDEFGERFFGNLYFAKRKIAAIGFVDNYSRWFPQSDMQAAVELIRAQVPLQNFRRSVTYGVSMGAYGALRYSRMLGAHSALAFGPQWSINPALVSDFDSRYERFFDPAIHLGMEIVPDDLCPHSYVFYDPMFRPDVHHAAHIANGSVARGVVQTFMGHPGITFYTQTRLIDRIFYAARQDSPDPLEFRRLIRTKRAGSRFYWMGRAEWLKRTHGLRRMRWLVESYERAQAVTEVAIEHQDAIDALVGLTEALLNAGRQAEAQSKMALLSAKAAAGATHPLLCRLFMRVGEFERAREVAERVVAKRPANVVARVEFVRTLIDVGDFARANVEVDELRAMIDKRPVIWRILRQFYAQLGRSQDVATADAIIADAAFTRSRRPRDAARVDLGEPASQR